MNFKDSYSVALKSQLFQNELNWIVAETGVRPPQALFIPYAFRGADYQLYFQEVYDVFNHAQITLIDINSGDPASLIAAAKMIVIGGGDITAFITKMKSLVTPTFDPFVAIKNRVASGIPYIGWNEGSSVVSPKYFTPPSSILPNAFNASPYQIVCNYDRTDQNKAGIKTFLENNVAIKKVICQVAKLKEDGSSVRLEESGGGMIDSGTAPFPTVISYQIVNGQLIES